MYKGKRTTSFTKIGARTLNSNHSLNNQQFSTATRLRQKKKQFQGMESNSPANSSQFIRTYNKDQKLSSKTPERERKQFKESGKRNSPMSQQAQIKALRGEISQFIQVKSKLQNMIFILQQKDKTNNIRIKDLLQRIQLMKQGEGIQNKKIHKFLLHEKGDFPTQLEQQNAELKWRVDKKDLELKNQLKRMGPLYKEKRRLKRELQDLIKMNNHYQKKYLEMKAEWEAMFKLIQKQLAKVQADLTKAQQQLLALHKLQMEKDAFDKKYQALLQQNEALKEELNAARQRIKDMEEEISVLKEMIQGGQQGLYEDKLLIKKLKGIIKEKQETIVEYQKYDEPLQKWIKTEKPVILSTAKLDGLKDKILKEQNRVLLVQQEKIKIQQAKKIIKEERDDLEKKYKQLQNYIDSLETRNNRTEKELLELKEKYKQACEEIDTLSTQLQESIKSNTRLREDNLKIDPLEKENKRLKDLIQEIERQLKEIVIDPAALKAQMRQLKENEKMFVQFFTKLYNAEKSTESDLKCKKCLKDTDNATTLEPCGHTFCFNCVNSTATITCPACMREISGCFKNKPVEDILPQIQYKLELFQSLKQKRGDLNAG